MGGVSVKVIFSSHLYLDGLMVLPGGSPYPRMDGRKIATYFRMDTGCLNHNTSMKNCKCFFNSFSLTLQGKVHFAFSKRSFEQYQVSDYVEMLEE